MHTGYPGTQPRILIVTSLSGRIRVRNTELPTVTASVSEHGILPRLLVVLFSTQPSGGGRKTCPIKPHIVTVLVVTVRTTTNITVTTAYDTIRSIVIVA
eukprot:1055680-Rhodomonas_salina.1